jgi:hypothetical protein
MESSDGTVASLARARARGANRKARNNYLVTLGLLALAACGAPANNPSSQETKDSSASEASSAQVIQVDTEELARRLQSDDAAYEPSSESPLATEQTAGRKLADGAFGGMVDLGTQEDWSLYFDKDSKHLVATNWKQALAFSAKGLQDGTVMSSLQGSGIPNSVLGSWKGTLCRAACWAAAGAGCAAVSVSCGVGTTFTAGGFAIPCTWAIVAACSASAALASGCSDWCSSTYD